MKKCFLALLTVLAVFLGGCSVTEASFPETSASSGEESSLTEIPSSETSAPAASDTLSTGNSGSEESFVSEESRQESEPDPSAARAAELLSAMSVEEKVGQIFLVRCQDDTAMDDLQRYHLGGFVLFAANTRDETPDSLRKKIASFQNASAISLLIAVDEEGGTVTRLSRFPQYRSENFPSPQDLYTDGGFDAVRADAEEKCDLLLALGINVNLAPVADVSTDPADFIFDRSFGQTAPLTAEFVRTVVSVMNARGLGSTLKHFPGYGGNKDTHVGSSQDVRTYESFLTSDFTVFSAGIEVGADAVMISHNTVECMDAEYPASLSQAVHRELRETLGFDGVAITDDLAMQAVTDRYGTGEAAVLAVLAGNDLLATSDYQQQIPSVLEAVQNGTIPVSRLDEAVTRVILWKLKLGILE